MRRLIKEVDNLNVSKSVVLKEKNAEYKPDLEAIQPINTPAEWTENQVEKWSIEKKILKDILENILPCNGKILNQLYNIKVEAPEFFYKSISSNKVLPTREIAIFTLELDILFKKN